jgi:hypothetical protein
MHTINKIIEIKPFKITVLFDKLEKREIDFEPLLKSFPSLSNEATFKTVTIDDYPTLSWDKLATIVDYDGTVKPAALDFCPDTLYQMSKAL